VPREGAGVGAALPSEQLALDERARPSRQVAAGQAASAFGTISSSERPISSPAEYPNIVLRRALAKRIVRD